MEADPSVEPAIVTAPPRLEVADLPFDCSVLGQVYRRVDLLACDGRDSTMTLGFGGGPMGFFAGIPH